ncbi:YihY/virulence factor BrkB family protein [Salinigranum halophilum]|uniref:YihY/virulence factor BrkB family protein n=1 Tax=Salinigranum halophilum TaxID=2565931 RepID=UPI0010A8D8B6|nr:YihY/virulence factor BrkB family protein [Salinigranum halophilum]
MSVISRAVAADPRVERAFVLLRAIVHEIRAERLTFMAGSIAYHAFVSLLPLLLLVLAVVARIGDQSLQTAFENFVASVITPGAAPIFVGELSQAGGSAGLSLFGLVFLVWGTLRIFRGLDTAFSDIYESEAANTFADQVSDGILVLVVFGVTIVVAIVVESQLSFGASGVAWVAHRLVLVALIGVALFPMYYVFPDSDVSVVEVLPGVAFAAVGLASFETLFQLYASVSSKAQDPSIVAGILVLLTWLYFSGLVILLGAAINAVLSNRSRDVNVQPLFGGVDYDNSTGPDRDDVTDALEALEHALEAATESAAADDIVVTVGDRRMTLPLPDAVVARTDTGLFAGPVTLELTWSPRESE